MILVEDRIIDIDILLSRLLCFLFLLFFFFYISDIKKIRIILKDVHTFAGSFVYAFRLNLVLSEEEFI